MPSQLAVSNRRLSRVNCTRLTQLGIRKIGPATAAEGRSNSAVLPTLIVAAARLPSGLTARPHPMRGIEPAETSLPAARS